MPADDPKPDFKTEARKFRDCLQSVNFLYQLKLNEVVKLLDVMKRRLYPAGQTIIKQGEKGDAFYLIASGKVSVWVDNAPVTSRYPGEFFGESALVTESPRSATVKAVEETELYVLYKDDFQKILMANPSIASSIKAHVVKLKLDPY